MDRQWMIGVVLALGAIAVAPLDAQENTRVGVDLAVSTASSLDPSIGATLHLNRRFALRPRLRYVRSELKPYSFTTTDPRARVLEEPTQTSELWGGGLALAYYLRRSSDLSPYVFAGLDVDRQTFSRSETTYDGVVIEPASRRRRTTKGLRGGLGLQYGLKEKLAVFGEVGLRHEWSDQGSSTAAFSSSLGVRFYLK